MVTRGRHHRGRERLVPLLLAVALAVAGCGTPAPAPEEKGLTTPAADGRGIVIALVPERNVFEQKKRYQPLQEYLTRTLGSPVTFKLLDNYQLIFSQLLDHQVEGGFFGSMNGTIAQMKGGVEILARPVDLNGVSTYSGYLFARDGIGITASPATWKGRRIALVNKATTAGYLYPLALLRTSGYAGDPEGYFSKMIFAGSHDAAILAVFNGEADLGACKNTVFADYVRVHPEVGRAITILAESVQVPSNGLGVRPDLTPETKRRLKEALLGMHTNEDGQRALRQFQAQRFVETVYRDYEPVVEMAGRAGIDLAGWPLRDVH